LLCGFCFVVCAQAQSLSFHNQDNIHAELSQFRASTFIDGANQHDEQIIPSRLNTAPTTRASVKASMSYAPAWGQGWRAGVFAASHAWMQGTPSSANAAIVANRIAKPSSNANHSFDVVQQSMQRYGFSAGKEFASSWLGGAAISGAAHVFAVNAFREISASGVLTESANGDLGLVSNSWKHQLGGEAPFINPPQTLGKGASIDLGLRWGDANGSHVAVQLADIASYVRLDNVLQTNTRINTNKVSFDVNGYIQFAPIISGKNADVPYLPKLHPVASVSGAYRLSPAWAVLAGMESAHPMTELSLGSKYSTASQSIQAQLFVSRDVPASLGITWHTRYLSLSWRGDKMAADKAKVWGISGQVRF
jgi:hypothetical protein